MEPNKETVSKSAPYQGPKVRPNEREMTYFRDLGCKQRMSGSKGGPRRENSDQNVRQCREPKQALRYNNSESDPTLLGAKQANEGEKRGIEEKKTYTGA